MKFLRKIYHLLWAALAAVVYRWPSRKIFVIGITGTKGKTTSAHLAHHLLTSAGRRAALLSSDSVAIGMERKPNLKGNTMPGRGFIQKLLRRAVKAGCRYAVVEVTSQGVEQGRHKFIRWEMAAFLNIHPEHIEAHGSFEKYREAKIDWFRYINRTNPQATFFINQEDENGGYFEEVIPDRKTVWFKAEDINYDLPESLGGELNRPNAALAAAIGKELGLSEKEIKEGIESFSGVKGRMEIVQREPFTVVIDYAYTPDSVELTYRHLAGFKGKNGKIISVFGSAGGGRDKWKRPKLGEVAERYCEKIILTTEEPYNEEALDIMNDIAEGIKEKEGKVLRIVDRREAIRKAVQLAEPGDVVALLGKGSEPYIHLENKKIPWDERKITEEILEAEK